MNGVVAVLDEHPAPIAELHPDDEVGVRKQAIDILRSALRRRWRLAIPGDDLAFFKMDVNGVVPVKSALQGPLFGSGESWLRRDAPEVRLQRASSTGAATGTGVVGGNAPGASALAIAEVSGDRSCLVLGSVVVIVDGVPLSGCCLYLIWASYTLY